MRIVLLALLLVAACGHAREVGMKDGMRFPALTLPTVDGKPFELASLAGKKVLLFHFASW